MGGDIFNVCQTYQSLSILRPAPSACGRNVGLQSDRDAVWANFTDEEGRIEGNIGRDPRDRLRMEVFPPDSETGKPAVTHYRVMERFGYTTLVECILETGRTHQIRAHMRHIGHPLFGDERYGGTEILRGERSATYKAFIQNCFKLCHNNEQHQKKHCHRLRWRLL